MGKDPHGWCSIQFKKRMVTGIYSSHSVLINGIPQHRSVTSEDGGSNGSSESDSSTPLLYGTEPSDSSTELEEAESDNDDAENERGPLNRVMEEVHESRQILCRNSRRQPPSTCHLCDCEIREECRRKIQVQLQCDGNLLQLPQWFIHGHNAKLTRFSMLENFQNYIQNVVE